MENITQGEISYHRDAVLIEVVAELPRRDEYSVEKLLDWPDLGFKQNFTNKIHQPLYFEYMDFLRMFHYSCCAYNMSSRRDV